MAVRDEGDNQTNISIVPLNMKGCICHKVADTPFHIQGGGGVIYKQLSPETPDCHCQWLPQRQRLLF